MLAILSRYKEKIYSTFVFILVFLFSVFPYADPDWGWHYKYGQYFLTYGHVLTRDIFSWTMTGYPWYYVSWIFDVFLFLATNLVGFRGLIFIQAGLVTGSFYLLLSNFHLSYWKKAILALIFLRLSEISLGFGIKEQSLSVFFLSLLLFLLFRSQKNNKYLLSLPFLFLLWTNTHGDFVMGFAITIVYLGTYLFYRRKEDISSLGFFYLVIILTSFLVTFLNPFSYHTYSVIIDHMLSPNKNLIDEWKSLSLECSTCHTYSFSLYVVALLVLFAIRRKIQDIPYILSFAILLIPAITAVRFLSLFCLVTLPFLASILEKVKWDFGTLKLSNYLVILIFLVSLEFNLFNRFALNHIYTFSEEDYCVNAGFCSPTLTNYLIQHPPQGRGLNSYDMGGYLIGKGFPVKLFIDGRMSVWEVNGYNPLSDYHKIVFDQDYGLFNRYNFNWVIINDNSALADKLKTQDLGIWQLTYANGGMDYFTRKQ